MIRNAVACPRKRRLFPSTLVIVGLTFLVGCSAPADPVATGGVPSGGGTGGTGGSVSSGGVIGGEGGADPCESPRSVLEFQDSSLCESSMYDEVSLFRWGTDCDRIGITVREVGGTMDTSYLFALDGEFTARFWFHNSGIGGTCTRNGGAWTQPEICVERCTICRATTFTPDADLAQCGE